jgi:predicted deacylase
MINKDPEIFTFEGSAQGPRFVVFGGVHGNEKCGPQAINRIMDLIRSGDIRITGGKVTFVPICNPLAYEKNVRFVERNLNRFFYPKETIKDYEDNLDLILCPVAAQADYLLDLHSYTSQGGAFIFLENLDEKNILFANALGVPRIIHGWADALQNNVDVIDKKQAMGTTEYAREFGAVAITLECGTHKHPRAADVGFQSILNAMKYLKIAELEESLNITDLPEERSYQIKMGGSHLKLRAGDFLRDWNNMDPIKKGEIIARYEDGSEIIMPEDGFIVLPKRDTAVGHEWFFWGVADDIKSKAA